MKNPPVLTLSDLETWLFGLVRRFESSARSTDHDVKMSRHALAVVQNRIRDKREQDATK